MKWLIGFLLAALTTAAAASGGLIFPYFTNSGGWLTLASVTNPNPAPANIQINAYDGATGTLTATRSETIGANSVLAEVVRVGGEGYIEVLSSEPLHGEFALLNAGRGYSAGGNALSISDCTPVFDRVSPGPVAFPRLADCLPNVSRLLATWSTNPALNVDTDWIVLSSSQSCIDGTISGYDRAGTVLLGPDEVIPGPAPTKDFNFDICPSITVFTFGDPILSSGLAQPVDLDARFGWAEIGFDAPAPVTAFAVKRRIIGGLGHTTLIQHTAD